MLKEAVSCTLVGALSLTILALIGLGMMRDACEGVVHELSKR